jgi:hypothetical protein
LAQGDPSGPSGCKITTKPELLNEARNVRILEDFYFARWPRGSPGFFVFEMLLSSDTQRRQGRIREANQRARQIEHDLPPTFLLRSWSRGAPCVASSAVRPIALAMKPKFLMPAVLSVPGPAGRFARALNK